MLYTSGTCAEVYRGTWDGEPVAVKVLRATEQGSLMKLKGVSAGAGMEVQHVNKADLARNSAFARR